MILGGKLPGKVGRCRFFKGHTIVCPFFSIPVKSILSGKYAFLRLCSKWKKSMKALELLEGLIWTLMVK